MIGTSSDLFTLDQKDMQGIKTGWVNKTPGTDVEEQHSTRISFGLYVFTDQHITTRDRMRSTY